MLGTLIQFNARDVPLRVAVRNALAIVLPLLLGLATGHIDAGLGMATGALTAMFTDQPGPYRLRAVRMLASALVAALSALVGSLIGANDTLTVATALLWGFAGGLLVALGPDAARAGLTAMILLVITTAQPRVLDGAAAVAVLVLAGGVLQTLFAIAAWPLQRYGPERQALARMCRTLADSARSQGHANHPPPATDQLIALDNLLHGAHRARAEIMQTLRVLAELLERARREIVTLIDLHGLLADAQARASLSRTLDHAARILDIFAAALASGEQAPTANAALADLDSTLDALARLPATRTDAQDARALVAIISHAQALSGQLRALLRNVDIAGSRGDLRALQAERRLPLSLQPRSALATLRANLNLSSVAFRHALRCGACLASAVAIERALDLAHGYWIPMTLAIVLKPDFAGTFKFGLLRVVGTLLGLALTTVVITFAFDDAWLQVLLLGLLCVAYRMLAGIQYALGVMMLTGIVVILLGLGGEPPLAAMSARAVATAIGSAAALLAYLLWPTWERSRLLPALATMLDAYRRYLLAVVGQTPEARIGARRAARSARTNAQASIERLRGEPRPDTRLLAFAEGVFANANRLIRACMTLEAIAQKAEPGALREPLAAFMRGLDDTLAALVAQLNGRGDADLESGRLRTLERQFARQTVADTDAGSVRLVQLAEVLDRMTDSVDTLAFLLRERFSAKPG